MTGLRPFLHMDDQWMWRFYFLDSFGKLIAMSTVAFFTREEAEHAMRVYLRSLLVIAT